ncbi:hypothetical protein, partial [Shewanella algae]|uniref:hypothetical protein n=1 Tax=Shewanella algae TaxID=38313 RepID=UPI001F2519CD
NFEHPLTKETFHGQELCLKDSILVHSSSYFSLQSPVLWKTYNTIQYKSAECPSEYYYNFVAFHSNRAHIAKIVLKN